MKAILFSFLLTATFITYGQQVQCHFTYNANTACALTQVQFNDASTGSPTSSWWDLGNGEAGNIPPTTIYYTPGVYIVKHVVSNATSSDSCVLTVTIKPVPAPPALSWFPTDTVCAGETIVFTALPDTADSYIFYVGSSVLGESDSNVLMTNQLYNLNVVRVAAVKDGCRSVYPSNTDTIYLKPVPIVTIASNNLQTCSGDTITVVATSSQVQASVYDFYINSVLQQTSASDSFVFLAGASNDTITATGSLNGCSTTSRSIPVVVNPVPVVSLYGQSTTCVGDPALFYVYTLYGGAQPHYQWQVNGIDVGTDDPVYTYTSNQVTTDTVVCVLTSSISCATPPSVNSGLRIIHVLPNPPVPVITESANGDTLFSSPAQYYQWYLDSFAINNANQQLYIPAQNGSYTVAVSDSSSCSSLATVVKVSSILGISAVSLPATSLQVFPNPATNQLYFSATGFTPQWITLYDISGKKLNEQHYQQQIDISTLSAGVYFVEVRGEGNVVKKMVVKE